MEFVDILAKLREYEKAGHSVGDAIKGAEMTQPVKQEAGMSDVHIGAQELLQDYMDDNGNLKMIKDTVIKDMETKKAQAEFPQSYEIETAIKMVQDDSEDNGEAKGPNDIAMNKDSEQPTGQPIEEKAKPDFLDMDKDGDKTEPMQKAVKDKEMKKETVKEAIQMSADTPEEGNMLMQILKLAGVQQVSPAMLNQPEEPEAHAQPEQGQDDDAMGSIDMAKLRDLVNGPQEEQAEETFANEPDEKVQDTDTLVNFHSGGLNRQKSQIAKGHPGDNELAAEDLANRLTTQYESFKKSYQTEAAKAKPDFLDMDKDGDKKEPMKKAVKEKGDSKDSESKGLSAKQKKLPAGLQKAIAGKK